MKYLNKAKQNATRTTPVIWLISSVSQTSFKTLRGKLSIVSEPSDQIIMESWGEADRH